MEINSKIRSIFCKSPYLVLFTVSLQLSVAQAHTIFFRSCGDSSDESKLCAVNERDSHWSELFALRLQHEWPMSMRYEHPKGENRTEERRIQDGLNRLNDSLKDKSTGEIAHYSAIWIPPTLYEKAAINTILENHSLFDSSWYYIKKPGDRKSVV